MAEQDHSSSSPSKRKSTSQNEVLPEAKQLRIAGDISPASSSPATNAPLTPSENILIDKLLQCRSEREQMVETLYNTLPDDSSSRRTPFREEKAEETMAAQELRQSFQEEKMRKELLDRIMDCRKKNLALLETKDTLEKTLLEHMEVEKEMKSLAKELLDLQLNLRTEETDQVQEAGSSSSAEKMED